MSACDKKQACNISTLEIKQTTCLTNCNSRSVVDAINKREAQKLFSFNFKSQIVYISCNSSPLKNTIQFRTIGALMPIKGAYFQPNWKYFDNAIMSILVLFESCSLECLFLFSPCAIFFFSFLLPAYCTIRQVIFTALIQILNSTKTIP